MTTLGKILVIVNLVFSVVTGALIIMVYAVRTNWSVEHGKRVEELRAAQESARTYQEQAKKFADQRDLAVVAIEAARKKLEDQVKDLKEEVAKKQGDLEKVAISRNEAGGVVSGATEETKRLRATVDPHSPEKYRTNGVVSNMPQFQEAFHCKAGTPMVNQNRCSVW